MSDSKVGNCGYQGYEFGAGYQDSICGEDGYLWDADSGDTTDNLSVGGEIPCPKCNRDEWLEYQLESLDAEGLDSLLDRIRELEVAIEGLPEKLVDALFAAGSLSDRPVGRIQFMLGKYPNDTPGGGMVREALVRFFQEKIDAILREAEDSGGG